VQRTDFKLTNGRGSEIVCSHFEPSDDVREYKNIPCCIYMHGNSSCRLEALECIQYLLPQNITVLCFDFAGCGKSGGEYITLGWYERDDVAMIVDHLRENRRVSTIGLWGRSMGAVTTLLHADRDPSIAAIICDSPFSDLKKLVNELSSRFTRIPSLFVSPMLKIISQTIKGKAKFDIYKLSPINHVKNSFIPALFATANDDDFIAPRHCEELHEAYQGDKNLIKFEGDHNSNRPDFFFNSVSIFLYQTLQCDQLLSGSNKFTEEEFKQNKANFDKEREERRKKKENKNTLMKVNDVSPEHNNEQKEEEKKIDLFE
jgi:predicted alpha/beta-fold hydrolase